MALEQWSRTGTPAYVAGTVLFETRDLARDLPHCYHVMLVSHGTAQSGPAGTVNIPICDMTLGGIRYPQEECTHKLRSSCYFGYLPALSPESTRQAIEALYSLTPTPTAVGQPETYTLGTHGIHAEDPNAPGEYLTGIHCSCASLIEWCYECIDSNIDLVSESHIPAVSIQNLWEKFMRGLPFDSEEAEQKAAEWGLEGTGPWKILFPAYQMEAFRRETIPHRASMEDHPYTPDRPSQQVGSESP